MNHSHLTFGIHKGELLHISQVDSGLGCNCDCPACGSSLVAKKGALNQHHFSHYNSEPCANAVETALHFAAKTSIHRAGRMRIPEVTVFLNAGAGDHVVSPARTIIFDEVLLEYRIDNIIPDLIAKVKDKILFIEVFVTHRVDPTKLQKISALGASAIEIDLSHIDRDLTFDAIEQIAVEGTNGKRWLVNKAADEVKKRLLAAASSKRVVRKNAHTTIVRYCPIMYRSVDVTWECWHCVHQIQHIDNDKTILCMGHELDWRKSNQYTSQESS